MGRRRPPLPGRIALAAAVALAASAALAAAAVVSVRPERAVLGVAVAVAVVWGAAPLAAALLCRPGVAPSPPPATTTPAGGGDATVTTVVRLGAEPVTVAWTSVALADRAGPAAVIATTARTVPDELRDLGVPVHQGPTPEAALAAALGHVTTPAVLVLSARAVPAEDDLRGAATRLVGDVGWVVGDTVPFNVDAFAPDGRDVVGRRLRDRARAIGVELWEPDATLVRTELLRRHPLTPGRPWGEWLRDRRAEGHVGAAHPGVVSLRAAPAEATAFWPDTVARQRATAADVAAAAGRGTPRQRLVSVLLTLRELDALPWLTWLVVGAVAATSGRTSFRVPTAVALAAVLGVAVLRKVVLDAVLGRTGRPAADLLSALHHLPGSLAAVPVVLSGRLRPSRLPVPAHPLVWAALLLTVVAGAELVGRDPTGPPSALTVGLSLLTLVALWIVSVRALVQRRWHRTAYRVPLDLPARLDGWRCRTLDASPAGVALTGAPPDRVPVSGPGHRIELHLDDGGPLTGAATVVSPRRGGRTVGVAVELDDADRRRWVGQLLRSARRGGPASARLPAVRAEPRPGPWRRLGRAVGWVAVGAVSFAVLASLVLVMFGVTPLVVRSGSMEPALRIGDVVLSEQVPARSLAVGDVVTRPAQRGAETVTHRVTALRRTGGWVVVETRGDANADAETWSVDAGRVVGRVVARLPAVGAPVVAVRSSLVRLGVLGAALVLAVGAILRRPSA